MKSGIIILYLIITGITTAMAQHRDSIASPKKRTYYKATKAAEELQKTLTTQNDAAIAKEYESLSVALATQGDYQKAEDYLAQAINIYTRLNDKESLAVANRNMAKLLENQKKIAPAIQRYETAAQITKDTILERINLNDASRLRNKNPQQQEKLAQENIQILEEKGTKQEVADAYKQLAETQLKQNNTSGAVANYKNAIHNSLRDEDVFDINKKITRAYIAVNSYDSAITVSENNLQQAISQNNYEQQVLALNELASLYAKKEQPTPAINALQQAYQIALQQGNTHSASTTVLALANIYQQQKNLLKSISVYSDFLTGLDSLLKRDSSLVDAQLLGVTEAKIRELETERKLQNELISKQNRFNYILSTFLMLLVILLVLIVRAWLAIRKKNKKIALQSLRREMNPHFIFNSLNSINQYIAQNNEIQANRFLTSYSSLMRNVMEHSNKDFVPLSVEVDQLKKYLTLEHQRFSDQFDYEIKIDADIDPDAILLPNMLIQPHLENAIWHGLRYKTGKGKLLLQFIQNPQRLLVVITDDGIGIEKSRLLKTEHQRLHQSRGISNTRERIHLLNEIYKTGIHFIMEEIKEDASSGTRVVISLPIIHKTSYLAKN